MKSKQKQKSYGLSTRAIHVGTSPDPQTGALVPPIYQTSTFVFPTAEEGANRFAGEEGYIYSRLGNPTVKALEQKVANLESAEAGLAFGSGMAAVSAVLLGLLRSGDHVICSRGLYGCTFGLLRDLKERFHIDFTLCDMTQQDDLQKAIQANTKVIYIETPINPTLEVIDLEMVASVAKTNQITTVVDNTFMTPFLQRPLEFGCDLVLHSATKYIGGHGDVVAGIIAGKQEIIDHIRMTTQKDIGGILSPWDAFLLIRGLKTLGLRMERHTQNAFQVARFLEKHPQIESVYYPGLSSSMYYPFVQKQMDGAGGIISFEVKGDTQSGIHFMNQLKLCKIAVSLGDVDTLIQHPSTMTHAIVPEEERLKMGITPGLIRLSVGIEDVEDVIADLEQALSAIE
ncbi:methionine gamma-lyase [Hazenella sp. IB182357]|uniref:L-methionine gamma-lyase n=1 Tax=Polycladospora coralii TaxID=2771432 RepID=A0A926NBM8_9BACL|nr:methionine gamma-lyase [Polycladospora coralii]MBD1373613.1 methionine gamma-lyase [Polycladospora coralii]MBS7529656.1 methionine gamma-lyase [Polycladospora coralii]